MAGNGILADILCRKWMGGCKCVAS